MFLKESGIALEVGIFKRQNKNNLIYEENHKFTVGVGMYDFIDGSYRGLSQVEEAAVAFGMDLKQVREVEAKQEEFYKKHSLEVGRDIRFPTEKELKRREESGKRITSMVRGNLNE